MIKTHYDTWRRNEEGDLVVSRRIWRYCVKNPALYTSLRSKLPRREFRTLGGFITSTNRRQP